MLESKLEQEPGLKEQILLIVFELADLGLEALRVELDNKKGKSFPPQWLDRL